MKESNGFDISSTANEVLWINRKYKIDLNKYMKEEARKIISVKYLLGQKIPALCSS